MQFNIAFKTIFEYILKKVVLCIQIHFVSTEKNTCIASRASYFFSILKKGSDGKVRCQFFYSLVKLSR